VVRSNPADGSDPSTAPEPRARALRPSGGYRTLRSFQTAALIYDATVSFCDRFVDKRSRTMDQMVQAARSGRQNIAEGSRASATSSQTELRLANVARASLDELLLDYEDFLRQRGMPQWAKDDSNAMAVRQVARQHESASAQAYSRWLDKGDAAVIANALICLIHQANYLLDQQIAGLERQFVEEGYSERLAAARQEFRRGNPSPHASDPPGPVCPRCGQPMRQRIARKGKSTGQSFWGCTAFPECKGTRPLNDSPIRSD
jgi:restriction system protein